MNDFDPDKPADLVFIITSLCIFFFGMFIQHSMDTEDRNCTVTITDMRGVQHVITGKADE